MFILKCEHIKARKHILFRFLKIFKKIDRFIDEIARGINKIYVCKFNSKIQTKD
jgi:hypothetical protein